jgi:hypothetical protein
MLTSYNLASKYIHHNNKLPTMDGLILLLVMPDCKPTLKHETTALSFSLGNFINLGNEIPTNAKNYLTKVTTFNFRGDQYHFYSFYFRLHLANNIQQ